jgi:hypothetical protein
MRQNIWGFVAKLQRRMWFLISLKLKAQEEGKPLAWGKFDVGKQSSSILSRKLANLLK